MTRPVTSPVVEGLVADLEAEHASLVELLADLRPDDWSRETPAVGWTVRDQVAHLAHFDEVTRAAVADPEAFVALRDGMDDLQTYVDAVGAAHADDPGEAMLDWWRAAHAGLREAFLAADPAVRVPWFGPPMSLASKVTARVMETWAHGQDVADTVGVEREPTDRLRHVARIGVLAMPNSFATHGLAVPTTPVRVSLTAPDGVTTWEWGEADPDAEGDAVTGSALDFCLVVTQRRHRADTGLTVVGAAATAWLDIAQAFAGPPGAGRAPGQFA